MSRWYAFRARKPKRVMPALVAGIHVFRTMKVLRKAWIASTRLAMTVCGSRVFTDFQFFVACCDRKTGTHPWVKPKDMLLLNML
jgi:hypothetical protein